jgi:hypothetical protein
MEGSFYTFGCGSGRQYYRAWDTLTGEEKRQILSTGGRGYHKTVRLMIREGGKAGDLLGTFGTLFFVSDRVLQVFDENGFEKYETFPVEVSGGRGEPLPRYHGISFHGRGGPLLEEESGIVRRGGADGKRTVVAFEHGIVLDTSKWDGSDLFYLEELPGTKIVTARVKDAIRKAKVTNCDLIPIEAFLNLPRLREWHAQQRSKR